MASIDFKKKRKVIRGPYKVFDDSVIVEFLEPDGFDATVLIKTTFVADHPLLAKGKQHPVSPPLHVHFDQAESFKVLQGCFGFTTGYDEVEHIMTPDNEVFVVPPMLPHKPWVVPGKTGKGEDTVVLIWAHPTDVPQPLEDRFFETVFLHSSERSDQGKGPDLLQLMLSQHETGSAGVIFPSATFLGPLRWWIPWKIQAGLAAIARLCGYQPLVEPMNKKK